jgi:adenylate cyclase
MGRKIFETRYFGFLIGLFVAVLLVLMGVSTPILERLEQRMLDVHFTFKSGFAFAGQETVQEGVTRVERNPEISQDILILGIDFNTLNRFGQWPFPRYRHADLITSFNRISNQSNRERSLFLDLFFIEPSDNAYNDALLTEAIANNDRVFLETILEQNPPPADAAEELARRHKILFDKHGEISKVSGDWTELPYHLGLQPPLQPMARASAGYGHANFYEDFDEVFRRQPMIAKWTEEIDRYDLQDLTPQSDVDRENYERLAWFDRQGREHTVEHPLTDEVLTELRAEMEENAPPRAVDTDGDGETDAQRYTVRKFKDHFVPSITLSLAADYMNKELSDVEVVVGEHVRIPNPEQFNAETGEWEPYKVLVRQAQRDAEGNVVQEAEYRTLDEITIPIDNEGAMLINFMGPRSSPSPQGYQTFPVRPYAGYASNPPGPDPSQWPRTRAVENKILMVGAFSPGMAEDEKTTPYGLMYGVEMHANALNTILMDNFLHEAPFWLNALILVVLTLITAFATSRLPTLWSLVISIVLVIGMFLTTTIVFESNDLIVNFSTPALGVIFTFLAVVIYRVMTEEKDKRRIRDMFGRYVSPQVVEEILENPPELGGVDKELTVFFSDIRGFTTLSESMTPQELVNHLNVYLTAMTDTILEFKGTLDKYVGDEIMCFWGAPLSQPDHALLACKCAVKQMEKLNELNEQWPEHKRINIGIGLNSGVMTVGNMGSQGRMNYTLMGDNVNLGARLEGTNKMYQTNIIISEYTYGLVKDHVVARELDNIRVKGKNRPVVIYELLDIANGTDGST